MAGKGQNARADAVPRLPWHRVFPARAGSDLRPALREIARAQPQAVEADEAGRVALVVPALHALHRRDLQVVERVLRPAAAGDDVALVELEAHGAGNVFLTFVHQRLQ